MALVMAATKRKFSGDQLDQYVCSANDVVNFKFVNSEKDVDDDSLAFKAEFTHQFFGESENIFGYQGLQINMMYSACRLSPFFSMTYRKRVQPSKTGGIEADDVYKIISDKQELEPSMNLDEFVSSLSQESIFKPFGESLGSFSIENEGQKETYGVYHADSTTPGFKEYHQRMQTLILWFIDGASFIEEDEKWDFFILHKHLEENGKEYFPFVGYTTVYRYYAFPRHVRPRISQMMVLPTHQKRGLGSKLLETINNWYINDEDVKDMTVEDPSDEFIRIRDFTDCKRCEKLESFSESNLRKGFLKEMQEEARKEFKINKKQARRVYEILRLKNTDLNNEEEYKAYRLDVKNRLNVPFQREKLDLEKLQKTLPPEELKAAANPIPREQRMEQLNNSYAELEERYRHTIERMILESNGIGWTSLN